jgi:hypothetical protein
MQEENNEKSAGEIASAIVRKVDMLIMDAIPMPDCPLKKEKALWKRKDVKKRVGNILNPGAPLEITVSVTS